MMVFNYSAVKSVSKRQDIYFIYYIYCRSLELISATLSDMVFEALYLYMHKHLGAMERIDMRAETFAFHPRQYT